VSYYETSSPLSLSLSLSGQDHTDHRRLSKQLAIALFSRSFSRQISTETAAMTSRRYRRKKTEANTSSSSPIQTLSLSLSYSSRTPNHSVQNGKGAENKSTSRICLQHASPTLHNKLPKPSPTAFKQKQTTRFDLFLHGSHSSKLGKRLRERARARTHTQTLSLSLAQTEKKPNTTWQALCPGRGACRPPENQAQ
jgi:hypothetical protein